MPAGLGAAVCGNSLIVIDYQCLLVSVLQRVAILSLPLIANASWSRCWSVARLVRDWRDGSVTGGWCGQCGAGLCVGSTAASR